MIPITHIAEWYALATESADPTPWEALGKYVRTFAHDTATNLQVIVTDNPEPYADAYEQAFDMRIRRQLRISSAHCDHPVWDGWTNIAYRIWHDVSGHGTGEDGPVHPFTVAGELAAWRRSAQALDPSSPAFAAAWTETVGQLAYAAVTGDFGAQRQVILPTSHDWLTAPILDDRP